MAPTCQERLKEKAEKKRLEAAEKERLQKEKLDKRARDVRYRCGGEAAGENRQRERG